MQQPRCGPATPRAVRPEHTPYQPCPTGSPETGLVYRGLVGDEAAGCEAALLVARAPSLGAAARALEALVADGAPALAESLYAPLLSCALSRVDWQALAQAWQVEDDHSLARSPGAPASVTRSRPACGRPR